MMRHFRIFLLCFQYVFERRGVSIVWLLVMLINPLILLVYWRSALENNSIAGWSLSSISSYYFLLFTVSAFLMSHIEENVSEDDIANGQLVKYLVKPYSYFLFNIIRELPYRLLQGFFAIIISLIFILIFGRFFQITTDPRILFLTVLVFILAYILSYSYKIAIGLLAFWLTDANGLFQFMEIITLIFAGYVIPISLMPELLLKIVYASPFPYIIYYPVIILQGNLSTVDIIFVICKQIAWIFLMVLLYKLLWKKGIKVFTGMGQ